jgi:hypothetical protein
MTYNVSTADRKFEITAPSTVNWLEYWRVHGTSWRSLIELHFAICNRLQQSSSWWSS